MDGRRALLHSTPGLALALLVGCDDGAATHDLSERPGLSGDADLSEGAGRRAAADGLGARSAGRGPIPAADHGPPAGAAIGDSLDLTEEPGAPILPAVVCADGPTVPGIDVSAWQGAINWPAVAGAGQKFAFIRVSDGLQYVDDYFPANWQGARASGLLVGAYQFFRPTEDPIAQADLLLGKMGPLGPGILPPVIDVETSDGLAPNQVANKVGQWIDHVEAALGVQPIVYTGKFIWQGQVGVDTWASYPLWIAQYGPLCPDLPDQWTDWAFHQTSDSGKVPGIAGNVDTDLFNGSLADLQTLAGAGGPVTCGDGSCGAGEDSDTCAADCPPCGLIPPEGGIVDDPDACFHRFGNPMYWYEADLGWQGHLWWTHAVTAQDPDDYVVWELHFAEAGLYRAEVYIAGEQASAEKTVYAIHHAGGDVSVPIDQAPVDGWVSIGDYTFTDGGHGQQVRLNDNTGEAFADKHQIVFDALRLTRLDAPATTGEMSTSGDPSGDPSGTTSDSGGTTSGTGGTTSGSGSASASGSTTGESDGGESSGLESSGATGSTSFGSATADGGEHLDGGCACRSTVTPPAWALLGLTGVVVAARRRRRRG